MFRFPFSNYPYNNPYYRYHNRYSYPAYSQPVQDKKVDEQKNSITNSDEISNTIDSRLFSNSEQAIFDLFGIKLYLDDIIILCLLFFLYEQDIKDDMLYMILFLLLVS